MTDTRFLKKEAGRAKCSIEHVLKATGQDPSLVPAIIEDLKETRPHGQALRLPRPLMAFVEAMQRHPRPKELLPRPN